MNEVDNCIFDASECDVADFTTNLVCDNSSNNRSPT